MLLPLSWSVMKIQEDFKVHGSDCYWISGWNKITKPKCKTRRSATSSNSWNGEAVLSIWWNQQDHARDKDVSGILEGKNVHPQIWMIFSNINEDCLAFKKQNLEKVLDFSMFTELWPKKLCAACSLYVYELLSNHQTLHVTKFNWNPRWSCQMLHNFDRKMASARGK